MSQPAFKQIIQKRCKRNAYWVILMDLAICALVHSIVH